MSCVIAVCNRCQQVPLDDFAPYRISQVWHLTQTIRHISKAGSGKIILAGDLNCKPGRLWLWSCRLQSVVLISPLSAQLKPC